MKKSLSKVLTMILVVLIFVSCRKKEEYIYSGAIMFYTELDEKIVKEIKKDFEQTYNGVVLEYFHSSYDRMKEKITEGYDLDSTSEADVILLDSKEKMMELKSNSFIEEYVSNENKKIKKEYKLIDDYIVVFIDNSNTEYYIALMKNSLNQTNGKLLIDYLLSKKGQEKLVSLGFKTVRDDIK